jgi:hypothetical protein
MGCCSAAAVDAPGGLLHPAGVSITVIVENDTIKLPVHVPDGTRLELTLPEVGSATAAYPTLAESLRDFIGAAQGLPEDFAAEHDHYLHGTPKRGGQ